jgi:hypothetical protein
MLEKKFVIYGMVAIVAISLGGMSFLTNNEVSVNSDAEIHVGTSPEHRLSSVYPQPPPLPAQKIVSNSVDLQKIQKHAGFTLLEPKLPKDFVVLSATYNPIYDEATIYYGHESLLSLIGDDLTMDDLLDMGVVVIDYERRSNMDNIDAKIAKHSQHSKGAAFDVDDKKGYLVEDDFVNRKKAVIFDETEGIEITIVYNEGSMSQVKEIAQSLYSQK